jgi:hypothetical protein
MIDLKQIKTICETATEKSLILIDEFGKGKFNMCFGVMFNIYFYTRHLS